MISRSWKWSRGSRLSLPSKFVSTFFLYSFFLVVSGLLGLFGFVWVGNFVCGAP